MFCWVDIQGGLWSARGGGKGRLFHLMKDLDCNCILPVIASVNMVRPLHLHGKFVPMVSVVLYNCGVNSYICLACLKARCFVFF